MNKWILSLILIFIAISNANNEIDPQNQQQRSQKIDGEEDSIAYVDEMLSKEDLSQSEMSKILSIMKKAQNNDDNEEIQNQQQHQTTDSESENQKQEETTTNSNVIETKNITTIFGKIQDIPLDEVNSFIVDRKYFHHIIFLYLRGDFWSRELALEFEKLPLLYPNVSFMSIDLKHQFVVNVTGRLSASSSVPRVVIIRDREFWGFGGNKTIEHLSIFVNEVTGQIPTLNLTIDKDVEIFNYWVSEKKDWPLLNEIGEVTDWLFPISNAIIFCCLVLLILQRVVNFVLSTNAAAATTTAIVEGEHVKVD